MRQTHALVNLHDKALADFDNIQTTMRAERLQCLQDRRFYSIAGAQWEGALEQQFANKPRFEVNKILLAVIRVVNEYRNNRVTVTFNPKDGTKDDELSDACSSLYRADEQDSCAEEAYDNAFEEAVGGGFGAFRLRPEYEDESDEEDDRQRIRIEPIFDADSCVFFDINSKRQDKSDARYVFLLTGMTREAYMEEWDDDPATWPKTVHQREFDWFAVDTVYIAEYYKIEKVKEILHFFRGMTGEERRITEHELEEDDTLLDQLTATGFREVRRKTIKHQRVHKYIMSGSRVLEDGGLIAGKHLPIIPVFGKRWVVDGIERCMGIVRPAKDSQRLKNMQLSKLGEISALSSVEKPIFAPEEMAGHQMMWAEDNVQNYPYLLANNVTDLNGNAIPKQDRYTRVPQIPPAMAALLQITEQDMQDILGNQQAGEEIHPNISGKVVELVQNKLDMQAFIYMSNFSKSIKRAGEVWLSMAADCYVEEGRKMKGVSEQGDVNQLTLLQPDVDKDGTMRYSNDIANAKFDVAVDIGASSASKRQSTVRSLMSMISITPDPETQQVLGAMAMMNMDGEGIGEVRDFFRAKLIRMGVVKPTDEEAEQLSKEAQAQQPDPNAIFLQASAQKAMADAGLSQAKTEETKAKTAQVMQEIGQAPSKLMMDAIGKVQPFGQSQ